MRRILRIAIYAAIILALYFWVMTSMKGCDSSIPSKKPVMDQVDSTEIDPLDSLVSGLDTIISESTPITNDEIVDGEIDYNDVDQKVEELEKKAPAVVAGKTPKPSKPVAIVPKAVEPSKPVATKPEVKTPPVSDGGKYMVMAGSYLLKENAEKMVKKLKKTGYGSAKVVVFSASQYHSVVAAYYAEETKAQSVASELKRKGIDSFVKAKQ